MIFRLELERLSFPALMCTHSEHGPEDYDACMRAAGAVNAAKTVRSVRLPVRADDTLEWLTIPAGETTKVHATYVYTDPFTCSVLGTRGPKKDTRPLDGEIVENIPVSCPTRMTFMMIRYARAPGVMPGP